MLLTELEPLARPYVKDCPKTLVHAEMRRAAREFCEQSHAWLETRYMGFGPGIREAAIGLDDGQSVVGIVSVTKQGETDPLDYTNYPDSLSKSAGDARAWSGRQSGRVTIGPIPTITTVFIIEVAVKPSLSGTEINDAVADAWGEGIADGAAYNLLMMEDSAWYSPDRAAFHKARFEKAITSARLKKSVGFKSQGSTRATGGNFI
jgi:hypothetical protein